MPHDRHEVRAETLPTLLPWGTPQAERDDALGGPAFWLAGGASLLLWTAVAILLTTV